MADFETIISQCSLFQGLESRDIQLLATICSEKKAVRGELLFVEGTPASGFYLVVQGQVKIYKSNAEGKEKILHICEPGESFAEAPVFHGDPYPASACAMKMTHLLAFPREKFAGMIARHPSLSLNMLANFAMKLRRFTLQIEDLALRDAPSRIASHLLYLTKVQKRTDHVTLSLPKGQLANLLGASPETLSRVFSRLDEEGVIRMQGKVISLLNLKELRKLAN